MNVQPIKQSSDDRNSLQELDNSLRTTYDFFQSENRLGYLCNHVRRKDFTQGAHSGFSEVAVSTDIARGTKVVKFIFPSRN